MLGYWRNDFRSHCCVKQLHGQIQGSPWFCVTVPTVVDL